MNTISQRLAIASKIETENQKLCENARKALCLVRQAMLRADVKVISNYVTIGGYVEDRPLQIEDGEILIDGYRLDHYTAKDLYNAAIAYTNEIDRVLVSTQKECEDMNEDIEKILREAEY